MNKLIDITGQRFGRLTVIKSVGSVNNKSATWLCECDCGNEKIASYKNLKNGHTKSCGCLFKEMLIARNKAGKKENAYDLSGEYGIGYTYNGEPFYFDLEDFDLIKDYCWHNSLGYPIAHYYKGDLRTTIKMHQIIMNTIGKEVIIDHINHNKMDNRKINLRFANSSTNQMNKSLASNNTSGVTGVKFHKVTNKWQAEITVDKNRIRLGLFENFDEAVKARKEAEEKYFGEYSYDNSIEKSRRCVINK